MVALLVTVFNPSPENYGLKNSFARSRYFGDFTFMIVLYLHVIGKVVGIAATMQTAFTATLIFNMVG